MNTELTPLQQDMLALLDETVAIYGENPSVKRSKSRSSVPACKYAPVRPESPGCAIGRLMTPEQQIEADTLPDASIHDVVKIRHLVPDRVRNMSESFLGDLQVLHDLDGNWDLVFDSGLSRSGRTRYEDMSKDIRNGRYGR